MRTTSIAARPHRVRLQTPGVARPDGDGGYIQEWIDLTPRDLWVAIEPASAAALERAAGGTAIASATHLLRGPWHPGVTTQTVVRFNGRDFFVNGVTNLEERSIEMVLFCSEVVP